MLVALVLGLQTINLTLHASFLAPPIHYQEFVYGESNASASASIAPPRWDCFYHASYDAYTITAWTCNRRNETFFEASVVDGSSLVYHRRLDAQPFDDDEPILLTLDPDNPDTNNNATNTSHIDDQGVDNPDDGWPLVYFDDDYDEGLPSEAQGSTLLTERRYMGIDLVHDKKRCDALGVDNALDYGLAMLHTTSTMFGQKALDAGLDFQLNLFAHAQHAMAAQNFWDDLDLVDYNANGYPNGQDLVQELSYWITGTFTNRHNFEYANAEVLVPQVVLLTHENLQGSAIGLAYVGATCHPRLRVALVETREGIFNRNVIVMAHELGHGLNMDHDGSNNNCGAGFIMAPTASSDLSRTWSSCSMQSANTYYHNHGLDCLDTTPPEVDTVCGNGIVDPGETCDTFGTATACCDGATCQLHDAATCEPSNHACCQEGTCQVYAFDPQDTYVCRQAWDDCDVQEICLGDGACPTDVHKPDGTPCIGTRWQTSGLCYQGECITGDDVCWFYGKKYNQGLFLDDGCAHHACQLLVCANYNSFGCFFFDTDRLEPDGMPCDDGNGQCINQVCQPIEAPTTAVCNDGVVTPPEECDSTPDCDPRTCTFYTASDNILLHLFSKDNWTQAWMPNNHLNTKWRNDLGAWRIQSSDPPLGNASLVLSSRIWDFPYLNISLTGFTRNFGTNFVDSTCALIYNEEPIIGFGYAHDNAPTTQFMIVDVVPNTTTTLTLATQTAKTWHNTFLQELVVVGLDTKPITWEPLSLAPPTLVFANAAFENNRLVITTTTQDRAHLLWSYTFTEPSNIRINSTLVGISWESDESATLFMTTDYGHTWTTIHTVQAGTPTTQLTYADEVNSVGLRLTFDPNGLHDYCDILGMDISYAT